MAGLAQKYYTWFKWLLVTMIHINVICHSKSFMVQALEILNNE
jgi:hypothetical protein